MKISFNAIGLCFEAEAEYFECDAGTYWEDGNGAGIEFRSLTCEGLDASFLQESSEWYRIEEAAMGAAAFEYGQETKRLTEDQQADAACFNQQEM